ncbi:hypothetical protein ACP70R_031171 [Stipagrostis hirtigluma subsp. patula]
MASTAAAGEGRAAADCLDEANLWWLRFNNGAAVDDADDDGDEEEGEAVEGAAGETAGMEVGGVTLTPRVVAGCGEAATETAPGDWGRAASEATASDAKAEIVARGGVTAASTETDGAGELKRSSPRRRGRTIDEEISGGNSNVQLQGEPPRRKRKAIAKRRKLQGDGDEVQSDMDHDAKRLELENWNLRLQVALKEKENEHKENQRLKLELDMKTKEIMSLQKQNEELKAENETLKMTAKPPRNERRCRFCQKRVFHDYRNCPERRRAAISSEEEEGEEDSA